MKRSVGLVLAALGLFLLVMMLVPTKPDAETTKFASRTVYSPGPRGARALYLLLRKMGIEATALRLSVYGGQPEDATLWMLGHEPLGRRDKQELLSFLRRGGRLVVLPGKAAALLNAQAETDSESGAGGAAGASLAAHPRAGALEMTDAPELLVTDKPITLEGAPPPVWVLAEHAASKAPVIAGWQVGTGTLVSLGTPDIVENGHIGQGNNGLFLAHLAMRLAGRQVFDEVKTGFGERDMVGLLAATPYRWAVAQAALAGLVALVGLFLRRFPIRPAPILQRRRTLDHIEAVARLWQRAKDAGLPLRAILRATRERAVARVGSGQQQEPFVVWMRRVKPELARESETCWQQAELLAAQPHPHPKDAQTIAAKLRQLEDKGASW